MWDKEQTKLHSIDLKLLTAQDKEQVAQALTMLVTCKWWITTETNRHRLFNRLTYNRHQLFNRLTLDTEDHRTMLLLKIALSDLTFD